MRNTTRPFAANGQRQMVYTGELLDRFFQIRGEFLNTEQLFYAVQCFQQKIFRHREGSTDPNQLDIGAFNNLFEISVTDTAGQDSFFSIFRTFDGIVPVIGKFATEFRVSRFNPDVVEVGRPREDNPTRRILFKPRSGFRGELFRDFDCRIPMAYSRCRTEQDGCMVLLRAFKCILNHLESLFRSCRVKYRDTGEFRKPSGILFSLGGNWAGVISRYHDQTAFNADVCKAHQRVRRDIQADLFHCYEGTHPGVTCSGCDFKGGLFINRPFDMYRTVIPFSGGFDDFRGWCTGITCNQPDTGGKSTECDCTVTHQIFLFHNLSPDSNEEEIVRTHYLFHCNSAHILSICLTDAAECFRCLDRDDRSCFAIRSVVIVTTLANAPGR